MYTGTNVIVVKAYQNSNKYQLRENVKQAEEREGLPDVCHAL